MESGLAGASMNSAAPRPAERTAQRGGSAGRVPRARTLAHGVAEPGVGAAEQRPAPPDARRPAHQDGRV